MNYHHSKRPFSSSPSQVNLKQTKKKLRILTASLSANDIIPNNIKTKKYFQNNTTNYKSQISKYKYRPQTSIFSVNPKLLKSNLFTKSESKLDCLNLIIDSNPTQYNNKLIKRKMRQINPIFIFGSDENLKKPKLSYKTDELYYKYNLLYANKTQNLIKTYSPKMRPASSSISSFLKKMKYNLKDNIPIFSQEEMVTFARAKCKDIGIELRDNILSKFLEYCKSRCNNRIADLSDSFFGINSMKFLINILYNNDRISVLNLSKNNFGDAGIELLINAVKDSMSLVSLDISSNSISYKGGQKIFSIFINQQSIIDLNISSHEGINRNRLTSKGIKGIVKYLEQNLFIETLNLSGNSLKNEGFDLICKGLNNNISLLNLNISNNDIQENGINKSIKRINTTKLYSINLSNNLILDGGLLTLTNNLRHFPELRVINISNCGIQFNGFKQLLKTLQGVRRIESLDISRNKLSTNRFEELKTYFCAFGIKYLNLSRCQLGDESAFPLGECLAQNETIRKLNISNNKITDIGFKSFIYLFNYNSTLENFDCSCNFISDISMKEFFYNIEFNRTLKYLNLFDNQLRDDMGTLILEILDKNKTLLNINLLYNRIQLKTIDEINQKLKLNNEKEKSKYIPNIMRNIKNLEFDPDAFKRLIRQIKSKKNQQITLAKKVKEDNKSYSILLSNELNKVEIKNEELKKVNDELKIIDKKISQADQNIQYVEDNLIVNEKQIKNKITEENHKYGEVDIINIKLKADYDLIKRDFDEIIGNTKIKYKESQDKVLDAQKKLNIINDKFIYLSKLYENMTNPEKLVSIQKREVSKKKASKKLKLSRRFSVLDPKKINDNNIKVNDIINTNKINENNKDNLLKTIPENNNMTASTSPTMPVNDLNNRKKKDYKMKSSKRKFQFNKNK